MSNVFILSPAAAGDIREIWEFIASDNLEAADRLTDELFDAMDALVLHPGMGHLRTDLAPEALRFWRVKSYMIIYLPQTVPLQIVRVLSGYRDIAALM